MKKKNFNNKHSRSPKRAVGVIRATNRGFAFLTRDDGEDIFIPAKELNGAIHGDTVEVDEFSDHGEVRRIIKIGFTEITGIYVRELRAYKVMPDNRCFNDIYVTSGKAETGDRVVVRLSRKDRRKGEIVAVLGKAGTLDADIGEVLFSLGVGKFGYKTLKEAEQSASREISTTNRRDFTQQACFTIDGEGSKDFDDAVYAERYDDMYRLYVHIADVAEYVPYKSLLDKEAFERGNSFYYGENVLPMLPEALCNDVCSLNENVPRLTLSVVMDINAQGEITGGEICESVICSHKRMTYEKADISLRGETNEYDEFLPTLRVLLQLGNALKHNREYSGNIEFDIAEPKFTFDHGEVVNVEKVPRLISHSIIEECMIAANRFVAQKFLKLKAPFVYREHEPPQPTKIEELNTFLAAFGVRSVLPKSEDIAALLRELPPEKKSAVSRMTLRSMSKAKYSTVCGGHFGLAIKEYCHFTSPIRRYSDLTVHRVIKAYLHGEELGSFGPVVSEAAAQASERERVSEKAERRIDEIYTASYMARFVGKRFVGIVSGVTEWGVYVELDNTAEGMIRAESLGETVFDPASVSMNVINRGTIRPGDRLNVTLVSASGGNILFEVCNSLAKNIQ